MKLHPGKRLLRQAFFVADEKAQTIHVLAIWVRRENGARRCRVHLAWRGHRVGPLIFEVREEGLERYLDGAVAERQLHTIVRGSAHAEPGSVVELVRGESETQGR